MSAIVVLILPLCLLAFAMFMIAAFVDGAFRSLLSVGETPRAGSQTASNRFPILELALASRSLTGEQPDLSQLVCPPTPFVPQVTDLEAAAIASDVRRRGPMEIQRVLERSRNAPAFCPMRSESGMCACSMARPLDCIGRCVAGMDSAEWAEGLGPSLSLAFRHHLESHQLPAETHRLDQALLTALASSDSGFAISHH